MFSHINIKTISFAENSQIKSFSKNSFSNFSIESISLPSSITILGKCSFYNCHNLKSVIFQSNSQIKTINEYTFAKSGLEQIIIPPSVTKIERFAFDKCKNLKWVDFMANSQLITIENGAFSETLIEKVTIPSKVKELKAGWCRNTPKLNNILISSENKNFLLFDSKFLLGKSNENQENFDILHFACRNIENPIIPLFIKRIFPFAFAGCYGLNNIQFQTNSKIELICKEAFSGSSIEFFSFPSKITQVNDLIFSKCQNLKTIDFSNNFKISSINKKSFLQSSIEKISIPSNVKVICDYAFCGCLKLKSVEFQMKSKLHLIMKYAFYGSGIEKMIIPSAVNRVEKGAFMLCNNLTSIEFLGKKLVFEKCFEKSNKLCIISFPNANVITIQINKFTEISENFILNQVCSIYIVEINKKKNNFKSNIWFNKFYIILMT